MRYETIRWFVGGAAVWLMGVVGSAQADHYRHLDEQAAQIVRKTAALRREAVHFRHTPHYRHFIEDADDLRRVALHVRQMSRRRADIRHLEADLRELDASFHHLGRVIRSIEHDLRHGLGHRHGDTRHVWEIMAEIEACIHHMQEDVAALRPAPRPCPPPRRVAPPTVYSHGYGVPFGRPGGITFQRGGFRIRLNF